MGLGPAFAGEQLFDSFHLLELQLHRGCAAEDAHRPHCARHAPGMAARSASPPVKVSLLDALYLFEFEFDGSSAAED